MTCWCYIIECKNNAQYTGITKDVAMRYDQHKKGRGARYTKMNGVSRLMYAIELPTRSDACRLERKLKKIGRAKRTDFISKHTSYYPISGEFGDYTELHSFLCTGEFDLVDKGFSSWIDLETLKPCIKYSEDGKKIIISP